MILILNAINVVIFEVLRTSYFRFMRNNHRNTMKNTPKLRSVQVLHKTTDIIAYVILERFFHNMSFVIGEIGWECIMTRPCHILYDYHLFLAVRPSLFVCLSKKLCISTLCVCLLYYCNSNVNVCVSLSIVCNCRLVFFSVVNYPAYRQ